MHISDGFLDAKTSVVTAALAVAGIAFALSEVKRSLPPRKMPLLGLAAAFIFAAQMLNFPVVAGSSGHLTGGALAAILLGPGPAVVVMCAVLILQCFLFADGGVTALGANLFNMAVVAPCVGYSVFCGPGDSRGRCGRHGGGVPAFLGSFQTLAPQGFAAAFVSLLPPVTCRSGGR